MSFPILFADAVVLGPYHSGNTIVDILLFGVWCFLAGAFFTLGARVIGKVL